MFSTAVKITGAERRRSTKMLKRWIAGIAGGALVVVVALEGAMPMWLALGLGAIVGLLYRFGGGIIGTGAAAGVLVGLLAVSYLPVSIGWRVIIFLVLSITGCELGRVIKDRRWYERQTRTSTHHPGAC